MALNNKQKVDLEEKALLALGNSRGDLVHGFKVLRDRVQVAAVYWSDLHPDNEVEVALCESRLTAAYDLALVHHWLERRRGEYPRPCETHKHGSDWPIFGLRYQEVGQFFDKCRSLRRGFLPSQELAELRHEQQEGKVDPLRVLLSSLRPNSRNQVMDLVKKAGVSVDRWYVTKDGNPVEKPAANPSYCYNWAFGGGSEPAVACLWHETLEIETDKIVARIRLRKQAEGLLAVARASGEATDVRMRARAQATRALQLDELIRAAWQEHRPLRVIFVEGKRRPEEELGRDSSTVQLRELDPSAWAVRDYNLEMGEATLVRGGTIGSTDEPITSI